MYFASGRDSAPARGSPSSASKIEAVFTVTHDAFELLAPISQLGGRVPSTVAGDELAGPRYSRVQADPRHARCFDRRPALSVVIGAERELEGARKERQRAAISQLTDAQLRQVDRRDGQGMQLWRRARRRGLSSQAVQEAGQATAATQQATAATRFAKRARPALAEQAVVRRLHRLAEGAACLKTGIAPLRRIARLATAAAASKRLGVAARVHMGNHAEEKDRLSRKLQ
eukprot:scaffold78983_cov75-Phaeocystis_antarctica.AAC.4